MVRLGTNRVVTGWRKRNQSNIRVGRKQRRKKREGSRGRATLGIDKNKLKQVSQEKSKRKITAEISKGGGEKREPGKRVVIDESIIS